MALIPRLAPKSSGKTPSGSIKTLIPRLTSAPLPPIPQSTEKRDLLTTDEKGRGVFTVGAGFKQNSQALALQAGLGPLRKDVADKLVDPMKTLAQANVSQPAKKENLTGGKVATSVARFIPRVIASVFTSANGPSPYSPQSGLTRFLLGADAIVPEETAKQLLTIPQVYLRTVIATIAGDKPWTPQTKEEKLFFGEETIHPVKQRIESAGDVVAKFRGEKKAGLGSLFIGSIGVGAEAILSTFLDGAGAKKAGELAAKKAYTEIIEGIARSATKDLDNELFQTVAREVSQAAKLSPKVREIALAEIKTKYLKDALKEAVTESPLLTEARKYMSAEEFVKAKAPTGRLSDTSAGDTLANYDLQSQKEWLGGVQPTKELTVYRATKAGAPIGPGDYITNSRQYALDHIKNNLGREGKVTELKVGLDELLPADAPKEFWYRPRNTGVSESQLTSIWEKANLGTPAQTRTGISRIEDGAPNPLADGGNVIDDFIKSGKTEASGVLSHPEIGKIDLLLGKPDTTSGKGYGVSKIVQSHPEVLPNLQARLSAAKIVERLPNRLILQTNEETPLRAIIDLQHGTKKQVFLNNAYNVVPRVGVEPTTPAASRLRSTGELPRRETNLAQNEEKVNYNTTTGKMELVGGKTPGQKLPEAMYAANRVGVTGVEKNVLKRMIQGASKSVKGAFSETGKTLDKVLGTISTRLKNIDPSLKSALRTFEFKLASNIQKDRRVADAWLGKITKLPDEEYADLDLAMKNGDSARIEAIVERHGIQGEYAQLRTMLDDVYKRAEDVGYDIGYQKNYFPRMVDDSEGLLTYLEKGEDWSIIDQAIKAKETELGRYLTTEEKAKVVNTLVRGYGTGQITLSKTGAMKARAIDVIDPEINQFYKDSTDALLQYIDGTNNAIEARKFFGKGGKANEFGNIEDSIGAYTLDLIAKGKITPTQEKELRDILHARFAPVGTSGAINVYKNLAYIDTMGSVTSAVTQIGDLAWALYKAGPIETIKSLSRAVVGKSKLTRADIGIEKIAQEFESASKSSQLVNRVFRIIGLNKVDALGKETLINSTLSRFRRLSNKPSQEFISKLKATFGEEKNVLQVIDDLKAGRTTEDVKLLAFNELLDVQPVALSEMPEQYLKGGNGRIFYMLKTFTIKQLDVYRNEVFQLMKTNPRKAIRNLIALSAALMVMNATADEIKDFILNRKTSLGDRVTDNILKLAGFSKFTIYKAKQEGVGTATVSTILPPFKLIDSLYKDISKANAVLESESIQSIPLGGKLYYWWFGKGAQKTADKADSGGTGELGLPSLGGGLPSLDVGLPKLPKF